MDTKTDTKTDTNPPNVCARCKGAGANVYGGGVWSHHFWRDCIEHLTARAEAAEAREHASMAVIDNLRDKLADSERTNAALAARVAELEAQLAAQGWLPVGSNPPPAGRMFEIRRANCSLFPTYAYGKPAKMAVGNLDGEFICWWFFGNGWEWRPHYELQPAPDAWRKGETTP